MIARLILVIFALALFAAPTAAQQATAIDGDTIKLDGTTYRLFGIDAPEMKQFCGGYPAGIVATGFLRELMLGKTIACEERARDRYGRAVAVCAAGGEDLAMAMVNLGMAWAFVRYSRDYVAAEEKARQERVGLHAETCDMPWDWRARKRGDK